MVVSSKRLMHISYETPPELEGGLIVRLDGALNALTADQLWETSSQLIDEKTRFVVVDFTKLSILTSAGIGILVRLYTRIKSLEGGLAVYGGSAKIRDVITIVMLDKILHVCDDEDQAWEAIREALEAVKEASPR